MRPADGSVCSEGIRSASDALVSEAVASRNTSFLVTDFAVSSSLKLAGFFAKTRSHVACNSRDEDP